MAREVIERLICDRCGKDGSSTVRFAVGRAAYELDLCEQDGTRFQSDMEKWTQKARRSAAAGARSARGFRGKPSSAGTPTVREWAKSQGIEVSDRGRVSADVIGRYNAAHAASPVSEAPVEQRRRAKRAPRGRRSAAVR